MQAGRGRMLDGRRSWTGAGGRRGRDLRPVATSRGAQPVRSADIGGVRQALSPSVLGARMPAGQASAAALQSAGTKRSTSSLIRPSMPSSISSPARPAGPLMCRWHVQAAAVQASDQSARSPISSRTIAPQPRRSAMPMQSGQQRLDQQCALAARRVAGGGLSSTTPGRVEKNSASGHTACSVMDRWIRPTGRR